MCSGMMWPGSATAMDVPVVLLFSWRRHRAHTAQLVASESQLSWPKKKKAGFESSRLELGLMPAPLGMLHQECRSVMMFPWMTERKYRAQCRALLLLFLGQTLQLLADRSALVTNQRQLILEFLFRKAAAAVPL